jgi:hypothetical protein
MVRVRMLACTSPSSPLIENSSTLPTSLYSPQQPPHRQRSEDDYHYPFANAERQSSREKITNKASARLLIHWRALPIPTIHYDNTKGYFGAI